MLPMLAPLAAFLLALPQTLAHPLSSLKRSDNGGNLLALWNGNPGPVYYSTSSHSCDKKSLAAVGTSFPLVLDIASYPYPSNLTSQTVLLNVGSYKKSPGQVFGIDWKVPQLGNQLFVFRLSDASGQVVYSDPTYTASGNSQPSSTDSGQSCQYAQGSLALFAFADGSLPQLQGRRCGLLHHHGDSGILLPAGLVCPLHQAKPSRPRRP